MKRILVDCTNTYSGGSKNHLVELFSRIALSPPGIEYTVVGASSILKTIYDDDGRIKKTTAKMLNRSSFQRHLWRLIFLPKLVRRFDLVFFPGGTLSGRPKRSVVMFRNMLPFMSDEFERYGLSSYFIKYKLLHWLLRRSIEKASGVIFLSSFAFEAIGKECRLVIDESQRRQIMIPHGVSDSFRLNPLEDEVKFPKSGKRIRLLYISGFDVYKNQEVVLQGVHRLRGEGVDVQVTFVGEGNQLAKRRFRKCQKVVDPGGDWSFVTGEVRHDDLDRFYELSDIFVYASSCENLPNILLEGMAGGLPIVCSNVRPMVDILGDGGVYFNPRDPVDFARAVSITIESRELRDRIRAIAYRRSTEYRWDICAAKTFDYLYAVASE